MTLKSDILVTFGRVGWNLGGHWVNYTAITRQVNEYYKQNNLPLVKGSTVERAVRGLAQQGFLYSDGKGNFQWRDNW